MATENRIDFKVRVTDEGLAPLANRLERVDAKTEELGKTATTTGDQLDTLGKTDGGLKPLAGALDQADAKTDELGKSAATTGKSLEGMGASAAPALGGVQANATKAAEGVSGIAEQLNQVKNGLIALGVGSSLVGMIQSAAETADEYANLAARIKLATGEGEAFEAAMAGVQQIALDTNSSLQGTGDLFARLTETGKSAGLSAQAAASQALALTESINQAVQLSGASAQASDAALQQLIQGLNGGALRGEEFNSVMEQSPRLAKALADGLGVTTGELRKMAEQGRLTSDVVITALQNQADTLKSEFETLPATVGRAVQNLSTAWTVYVGEADKATGASALAAQAIDALASNLATLAGYLFDAGQAGAAFVALRLAQTFLGLGVAAQTAAVQVAASATAITAAGAASNAAAASVGRFAGLLSGLKTFTLLGIVTNFQDIGTWIGEGIAKLQGYKDATAELVKLEEDAARASAEHARQVNITAQAKQLAADRAKGLTEEVKLLVSEYERLRGEGKQVGTALEEVAKKASLATAVDTRQFGLAMGEMKLSAQDMQRGFELALKGVSLEGFADRAQAAFGSSRKDARLLEAALDANLRTAIQRSGADFDVLSGGMSKAARSAINDTDAIINGLDRLKAQGVNVGQALEASLNKAVKTADSQAAIDALRSRVEQLRTVLGDKVADGLLAQIEDQAKKATGALSGLDGALQKLGITSDASLKKAAADTRALYEEVVRTGGSAREQAQAFEKMASAAIASGDSASLAFVRSQAAAQGFEVAVDDAGKTIVRAMGSGKDAIDTMSDGITQATQNLKVYTDWLDKLEKRNAEVKSVLLTDKDKFAVDSDGNRIVQAVDNRESAASKLEAMGVDPAKAKQLAAQVFDERGNYTPKSSGAYRSDTDTLDAVLQRLATQGNGAQRVGGTATPGSATGASSVATTSHTVTIKLGGSSTTVNTASARDADALTQFLAGLQDAARRAS